MARRSSYNSRPVFVVRMGATVKRIRLSALLAGACLGLFSIASGAEEHKLESYCLGNAWESCFIYFDGVISRGLSEEFSDLLANSEGPTVYVNSPGGDLLEALTIGRIIRQAGRSTAIGSLEGVPITSWGQPEDFPESGLCESACAYLFMGGTERSIGKGKLGFHRFYSANRRLTSDHAQYVSGLLVEYLVEMGIDARIFLAASKEGASQMYHISDKDASEYDIITPVGYGDLFLEPYLAGVVAASRRLDDPGPYDPVKQVTFFCEQGRPHVMLTADGGFLEGIEPSEIRLGKSDDMKSVPKKHLAIRNIDKLSLLTIEIPSALIPLVNTLRRPPHNFFYVDVAFSRAAGGVYWAGLDLSEMDNAMIDSAFRHCIR